MYMYNADIHTGKPKLKTDTVNGRRWSRGLSARSQDVFPQNYSHYYHGHYLWPVNVPNPTLQYKIATQQRPSAHMYVIDGKPLFM